MHRDALGPNGQNRYDTTQPRRVLNGLNVKLSSKPALVSMVRDHRIVYEQLQIMSRSSSRLSTNFDYLFPSTNLFPLG
jgi:hypothetical protein